MKLEICSFSGYKIYPSRGRTFIRGDSRTFHFLNSKTESLFHQHKNPRKLAWTVVFRKMHRKGISEEVAKKRTRRNVKYNRAVIGTSWDAINARRSEKTEAAKRKAERAKNPTADQKFSKQQARGAFTKVKATSR
ncbi:60S ribosomal protein L24 [Martensiomyces pterosporus]|nr:60S ribosomal protein L24 [Martensiomyces pterosporus]